MSLIFFFLKYGAKMIRERKKSEDKNVGMSGSKSKTAGNKT